MSTNVFMHVIMQEQRFLTVFACTCTSWFFQEILIWGERGVALMKVCIYMYNVHVTSPSGSRSLFHCVPFVSSFLFLSFPKSLTAHLSYVGLCHKNKNCENLALLEPLHGCIFVTTIVSRYIPYVNVQAIV